MIDDNWLDDDREDDPFDTVISPGCPLNDLIVLQEGRGCGKFWYAGVMFTKVGRNLWETRVEDLPAFF